MALHAERGFPVRKLLRETYADGDQWGFHRVVHPNRQASENSGKDGGLRDAAGTAANDEAHPDGKVMKQIHSVGIAGDSFGRSSENVVSHLTKEAHAQPDRHANKPAGLDRLPPGNPQKSRAAHGEENDPEGGRKNSWSPPQFVSHDSRQKTGHKSRKFQQRFRRRTNAAFAERQHAAQKPHGEPKRDCRKPERDHSPPRPDPGCEQKQRREREVHLQFERQAPQDAGIGLLLRYVLNQEKIGQQISRGLVQQIKLPKLQVRWNAERVCKYYYQNRQRINPEAATNHKWHEQRFTGFRVQPLQRKHEH